MFNFKKEFSRFNLCDSLLSCFSNNMIAHQFSQLEKGAAKGLCLEFILHEYASALKICTQLDAAAPNELMNILEKLSARPGNASQAQSGILDKLCIYCEALVQNSKIGENLLEVVDELRNTVFLIRTIVSRQIRAIASQQGIDELLRKLSTALHSFFPLLASIFQSSLECETAIFALVELRSVINRHLGEKTVEILLQQMFPDGPERLREFLSLGFEKRGFCDFCDRHESLFEELTWPQTTIPSPKPCS